MQAEVPAMVTYIVFSAHIIITRRQCFPGCPWPCAPYNLLDEGASRGAKLHHLWAILSSLALPGLHSMGSVQEEASYPMAGGLAAFL